MKRAAVDIEEIIITHAPVDIEQSGAAIVTEKSEQLAKKGEQVIEIPDAQPVEVIPPAYGEFPVAPPFSNEANSEVRTVQDVDTGIYVHEEAIIREAPGTVPEIPVEVFVLEPEELPLPYTAQNQDRIDLIPFIVAPSQSDEPPTTLRSQDILPKFEPLEEQDIILGGTSQMSSILVEESSPNDMEAADGNGEPNKTPIIERDLLVDHATSEGDLPKESPVTWVVDIEQSITQSIEKSIVTDSEESVTDSISVDMQEFVIKPAEDPIVTRTTDMFEQLTNGDQEEIKTPDIPINHATQPLEVPPLEVALSSIAVSVKEVEVSIIDLKDTTVDIRDQEAPRFVLRKTLHLDDKSTQVDQTDYQEPEGISKSDSIGGQTDGAENIFLQSVRGEVFMKQQESENEDNIQVTQQGDRIILSAGHVRSEDGDDIDSGEPTPIATRSELFEALELIDRLPLRVRSTEDVARGYVEDDRDDEEEIKLQVAIVVSEEMLDIIEGLMQEAEFSLEEGISSEKADSEDSVAILVTKDNEKIIFSSQKASIEDDGEKTEESLIPVKTTTELAEVFSRVSKLVVDASLQHGLSQDDAAKDERVTPGVEVIVSEDMLQFIEDMREKTSSISIQPEKNNDVVDPTITFSTNGEEKKQLTIDSEQLLEIHKFFLESRLDDKKDGQYEESDMWREDDQRSGDEALPMLRTEASLVDNTSESLAGIQEGSTIIYESKKRNLPKKEMVREDASMPRVSKETVVEDQYILLNSGDREIKIERAKLEKLMKAYAKKKQQNTDVIVNKHEYAPEELVQEDGQTQDMNGTSTWVDYQLLLLLSLLDEGSSYYDVNNYNFSNNFLWQTA